MAVKKLSVDMYEGQITALLGHNGAGNSADYSSYSAYYSDIVIEIVFIMLYVHLKTGKNNYLFTSASIMIKQFKIGILYNFAHFYNESNCCLIKCSHPQVKQRQ